MTTLEERIQRLEDARAVEKAMYRYWRCLDDKLFAELPDTFCEDAEADWGQPGWRKAGRAAIVQFLTANESRPDLKLAHFGHNPEVEILDARRAAGRFKLEDWVTVAGATVMRGFGRYDMTFEKGSDAVWRIKTLRLAYAYREEIQRYLDDRRIMLTPELDRTA